jgi:RHS repeat-associated protein
MDGTSASGWAQGVGSGGTVTSVDDAARFSKVLRFNNGGRFDRSFSARTERAFSFWFKHELYNHSVVLWATTSAGARRIVFKTGTGTDGFVSGEYLVHLGTGVLDGNWHRIERDLTQIVATQTPGVTYTSTNAVSVWSSRCYIDDMRFSNTVTVEHNVLGAGVVGHILRNRTTNASTGVATDRWFHYDQVGSVISESDAAGALAQTHHQDAFGNTQAAWQTGLWGGDRAGWHHNTKDLDGDTGLVYMYERWYSPETGTFMSSAPFPVTMEHQYKFTTHSPVIQSDPTGQIDWGGWPGMAGSICNTSTRPILIYDFDNKRWDVLNPGECTEFGDDYDACVCPVGAYKVGGWDEFCYGPSGPYEIDPIWDDELPLRPDPPEGLPPSPFFPIYPPLIYPQPSQFYPPDFVGPPAPGTGAYAPL